MVDAKKISKFLDKDLWRLSLKRMNPFKAFWYRLLRIGLLVRQGFTKNQVQLHAGTLTYYTLLGIVPIIALFLGIARGFNLEDALTSFLIEKFQGQQAVFKELIVFAKASLKATKLGVFAGLGFFLFLWTAIQILSNLELAINNIWEIKKGRPFARKFNDFLVILIICPLLIILANSVTIYVSGYISNLKTQNALFESVDVVVLILLNLVPYIITFLVFSFLYFFVPNTKVTIKSALIAGAIASIIYQLIQWIYINFQVGVSKYNAIYGSFAAIPLFLIWVHLSWVILFLGAKIAFALQNQDAYQFYSGQFSLSQRFKKIISLAMTSIIVKNFYHKEAPITPNEISKHLHLSVPLTISILRTLEEKQIIAEVKSGYIPASPLEKLTIKRVVDMIEESGDALPLPTTPEVEAILKKLKKFGQIVESSDANVSLKDL